MRELSLVIVVVLCCTHLLAQPKTLIEWRFDKPGDLEGWGEPNHVSDLRVEDAAMQGRIMDWDPFVRSPQFEIPTTPWQRIEMRLKTDCDGGGEFFWTNTTESKYGGFSPGKETHFRIIGDNQWHEYQVYPFWQTEKKIILLRLDLPRPAEADHGKKTFAVDWVRIVDLGEPTSVTTEPSWDFANSTLGWEPIDGATIVATADGLKFTNGDSASAAILSGPLRCPIEDKFWVSIEMRLDKGRAGYIKWVSSEHPNMRSAKFPIRADGEFHTYNVDVSSNREWAGDALLLGLAPSNEPGATVTIRKIAISEDPLGGPEAECTYIGLENAVNRAGPKIPLILNLINRGGEVAADLRIARLTLPEGVTLARADDWRAIPPLEPFEPATHRLFVAADGPATGAVRVQLSGPGAPKPEAVGEVLVMESLNLPKADYVPEPQPVESDYEVGALYFPGWPSMVKWEPIIRHGPQRKPVLGWYDEGNPECVDWQIKWAVEHGIQFFLVDWYWSAGGRHLEHWVNAFKQARHKRRLKWAMMWANHNAPNTHSEADQRKVTQYWLDNYFNMPEYYRIDDKPVVMIWSVGNMDRDLADKGGAKRLLDISQEMVKAAGYKGIYFVAMKWPEASTDPKIIQSLADKGFSMTSIYHYMHHGGKADDPRHFPFDLVAESSYDHWKSWHEAGIVPFLPNLSTGWDSRPWHRERATVIYDRTPELFRRICEDAKRFADETGVKRMVLAPLNEWGEGSYAEPNKEFGFAMYDVLRDVFCKKPAAGWPPNIAPADVGLGPYDLPADSGERRTAWDFTDGAQGWGPFMGVRGFKAEGGAIQFETVSSDPAIGAALRGIPAKKYSRVLIRMKIDKLEHEGESAQLFWSTTTSGVSEANSLRFELIGDGEYHDYVLPVGESNRWRGKLQTFRFDPCSHSGAKVSIEEVRLTDAP